jgi:hypothetical protein
MLLGCVEFALYCIHDLITLAVGNDVKLFYDAVRFFHQAAFITTTIEKAVSEPTAFLSGK